MKDRFIKELLLKLDSCIVTADQVRRDIKDGTCPKHEKLISFDKVIELIHMTDNRVEDEKRYLAPKTKFLYVEDGSVDLDDLTESLYETNQEIKVILYREGSRTPELVDNEVK